MDDKRLYKETFSHVYTSVEVNMEAYKNMKRSKTGRKILLIAAVVCLLAAIGITAYAADFLGLRSYLISDEKPDTETENQLQTDGEDRETADISTTETGGVLSLQGYGDTPESQALLEWRRFLESYDPGPLTNEPTGFEEKYGEYSVYDQTMADKLEEIAAKYGLKLHTRREILLYDQMVEAVGGEYFDDSHCKYSGYIYENGSFSCDGDWYPASGGTVAYQFIRSVRGTLTDTALYIQDADAYSEWQYEYGGRTFILAISRNKSLILADLGGCFVSVNVLAGGTDTFTDGYIESEVPMDREMLEELTRSFNWDVLANVIAPDLDAIADTEPVTAEPVTDPVSSDAAVQVPDGYTGYELLLEQIYGESQDKYMYYSLYDMDGDGTKELLLHSGTCEADHMWDIYTLEDGACVYLDSFPGGHSVLYARHEGGLYMLQGHMGYEILSVITMDSGAARQEVVSQREVDFEAGEDYTVVSEEKLKTAYITDYRLLVDGNPSVFYGWQTVDGNSQRVEGRLILRSAVTGSDAESMLDGTQPALETGQEYVVATFEMFYDSGEVSALDLTENHGTLIDMGLYFTLSNGDSNGEDISGSVQDRLLGKTVPLGGSVMGRVAFIREIGTNEPIVFVGFGNVMEYIF